jgi:two-component system, NarL family, nitrate/nitrite response regulator NarL
MNVLVVDDHPVLREGIAALLRQAGPDTVVHQGGDVAGALRLASERADLDVIVLDLMMPGIGGMEAIAEFGRIRPDVPVIVLSSSEDPRDARKALAQGALGYVPKSASQHTLLSAIRLVLNGELYVPPLILNYGSDLPSRLMGQVGRGGSAALTDRQVDVLKRLSEGQPNKVIAHELELSEKTVKAHITAIFKALNVVNRTQAALVGKEMGLI